ncbi:MAG: hypothetical protein ACLGIM_19665, partial [Alphaproteobacteria bacterium]
QYRVALNPNIDWPSTLQILKQLRGATRRASLPHTVTGTALSRMMRSALPQRRRTNEWMPRPQP